MAAQDCVLLKCLQQMQIDNNYLFLPREFVILAVVSMKEQITLMIMKHQNRRIHFIKSM